MKSLVSIENDKNPGPNSLKICYQNAQGLIPIIALTLKQQYLNVTKIYELNSYINIKPDIIMLNETWLKKCVDDHEVIKDKNFTIYRNDRTQVSHPSDSNNPNKFRKLARSNIQADIELGLDQCITEPTHNKGRILDLLLTNSKNLASEIKVISDKDFVSPTTI